VSRARLSGMMIGHVLLALGSLGCVVVHYSALPNISEQAANTAKTSSVRPSTSMARGHKPDGTVLS